jgi:hypothetical protein
MIREAKNIKVGSQGVGDQFTGTISPIGGGGVSVKVYSQWHSPMLGATLGDDEKPLNREEHQPSGSNI